MTTECNCPHVVDARGRTQEYPISHYMARALEFEFERVVRWHARHHDTGVCYSWLDAMRATAENPASFDRVWDTDMEDQPVIAIMP